MTTLGFSHYNLRVPHAAVDTLRDFYRDVVGLSDGPRPPFASHGHWLYAGGRPVLHLSSLPTGAAPHGASSMAASALGGFDHAAFDCADRLAVERTLQAHGVDFRRVRVPQRGELQLFLRDPLGHGIELNFAAPADTAVGD